MSPTTLRAAGATLLTAGMLAVTPPATATSPPASTAAPAPAVVRQGEVQPPGNSALREAPPRPFGRFSAKQMANAEVIVDEGRRRGLPRRALVIAIMTVLQESWLKNLGHLGERNDHDSLGLFQQRPSQGWGTPAQVRDPRYAASKFYDKLVQVAGWQWMPLTRAAQAVQGSAFPDAYAKHERRAERIVAHLERR